jgi:hypothetical protein
MTADHKAFRLALCLALAMPIGGATTSVFAQDANKSTQGTQRTEKKKPKTKQRSGTASSGTSQKTDMRPTSGYRPDPFIGY